MTIPDYPWRAFWVGSGSRVRTGGGGQFGKKGEIKGSFWAGGAHSLGGHVFFVTLWTEKVK